MTLGRGGGAIRTVILLLVIIIAGVAVVMVGTHLDGPSAVDDSRPKTASEQPAAENGAATETESSAEQGTSRPADPLGSTLEGPWAARMERWHSTAEPDGSSPTPPVRSTVVGTPVRAVPDGAGGFDEVAVQIAQRRWDDATTGIAESVPPMVWDWVRRALPADAAVLSVHAVIDSYQPEYIVRYETGRVLIRLFTSGNVVEDLEIEELPSPNR